VCSETVTFLGFLFLRISTFVPTHLHRRAIAVVADKSYPDKSQKLDCEASRFSSGQPEEAPVAIADTVAIEN
jgi:hypothetical protein